MSTRIYSILAGCILALSGCSVIDSHVKVAGWPKLEVKVHNVDYKTMRDRCAGATGFFSSPMACSYWDLVARTCDVYVVDNYYLEHELMHCAGYDHPGSTQMQDGVAASTSNLSWMLF